MEQWEDRWVEVMDRKALRLCENSAHWQGEQSTCAQAGAHAGLSASQVLQEKIVSYHEGPRWQPEGGEACQPVLRLRQLTRWRPQGTAHGSITKNMCIRELVRTLVGLAQARHGIRIVCPEI